MGVNNELEYVNKKKKSRLIKENLKVAVTKTINPRSQDKARYPSIILSLIHNNSPLFIPIPGAQIFSRYVGRIGEFLKILLEGIIIQFGTEAIHTVQRDFALKSTQMTLSGLRLFNELLLPRFKFVVQTFAVGLGRLNTTAIFSSRCLWSTRNGDAALTHKFETEHFSCTILVVGMLKY